MARAKVQQIPKRSYDVETWKLDRIKPYERNARVIPQKAIDKVAASLQKFGWRQPMVVDTDGKLIVGHTRRLAAISLGWTEGPVHIARDLTPEQIKAYRLMDNRSNEETSWNEEILQAELLAIQELDSIEMTDTGFDQDEIDRIIDEEISRGAQDEAPAGRDGSSKLGDLQYRVIVDCSDELHQAEILMKLEGEGLTCRALIS